MTGHSWNSSRNCLRVAALLAALALLTVDAVAQTLQMPGFELNPDGKRTRRLTPEEQEREKAIDDKYKSTMQGIPDKKAPADPWGNVRAAPSTGSR